MPASTLIFVCGRCHERYRARPDACVCGHTHFNPVNPNVQRDPAGLYLPCPYCHVEVEVKNHPFCQQCERAFPRTGPYLAAIEEFGVAASPPAPNGGTTSRPRMQAPPPPPPPQPFVRAQPGPLRSQPAGMSVPPPHAAPYGRPPTPHTRPPSPRVRFIPPPVASRTPILPPQPRVPYWNTYAYAYPPPMPPPPPPRPPAPIYVPIPPNPIVVDYGPPNEYVAPLTWAGLRRKTKDGVAFLCSDCGNPWVKKYCPHCRRKSPRARPVILCGPRPPRTPTLPSIKPTQRKRRARSPHPRRQQQAVAPAPWPTDIDWNQEVIAYTRPRELFDDILDNRRPPRSRFHPCGEEALVHTNGAPTKKLNTLAMAIQFWLKHQVPGTADFIDPRRLFMLEIETRNFGVFYTYREPFHRFVFSELGMEYLDYWEETTQSFSCGLTFKGLVRYLTLWILCEPRDATTGLHRLVNILDFPLPPAGMGTQWNINASQALGGAHPTAEKWRVRLHERIMELDEDPLETPDDPYRMLWQDDEDRPQRP